MKKLLIPFILLFLTSCGNFATNNAFNTTATVSIPLTKGEKYLGFSLGADDHTVWISTRDSATNLIYIRKVVEKGGFPFDGTVLVIEK